MKKLNSIADLKAAAKEYKPILDLRENHTDAIPDKRDILVCGGTGCTSSESLLIIEKLKEEIKKYFDEKGIEYRDFGTDSEERTDYPIYAKKVAQAVQSKECEGGILLCRSGYGMTVVANKFKGIRAASISNEEAAKFAKADDDINVITLGGDYLTINEAICIIRNWLATEFKGGRYAERLEMINDIESQNMK